MATLRPQQPTDSPIASIPTELLTRILELALEERDPFTRQAVRHTLQKVSYQWWCIVGSTNDYAVKSATQARKLAIQLKREGGGAAVRSLAVKLGSTPSTNRSGRIAMLLKECAETERLHLDFAAPLRAPPQEDDDGVFDVALAERLVDLSQLRHLELHNEAAMTSLFLQRAFGAWSLLETLSIHSSLYSGWNWTIQPTATPALLPFLRRLEVAGDPDLVNLIAPHVRGQHLRSLTVLRTKSTDWAHTAELTAALLPLGPQLRHLALPFGWEENASIEQLLLASPFVESLELECWSFAQMDPPLNFSSFDHLSSFSLKRSPARCDVWRLYYDPVPLWKLLLSPPSLLRCVLLSENLSCNIAPIARQELEECAMPKGVELVVG